MGASAVAADSAAVMGTAPTYAGAVRSLLAPWMAAVAAKLRELGVVSAVFAAVLAKWAVVGHLACASGVGTLLCFSHDAISFR